MLEWICTMWKPYVNLYNNSTLQFQLIIDEAPLHVTANMCKIIASCQTELELHSGWIHAYSIGNGCCREQTIQRWCLRGNWLVDNLQWLQCKAPLLWCVIVDLHQLKLYKGKNLRQWLGKIGLKIVLLSMITAIMASMTKIIIMRTAVLMPLLMILLIPQAALQSPSINSTTVTPLQLIFCLL